MTWGSVPFVRCPVERFSGLKPASVCRLESRESQLQQANISTMIPLVIVLIPQV